MYPWYTIKMSRLEDGDICKKNMDFESIIVSFLNILVVVFWMPVPF